MHSNIQALQPTIRAWLAEDLGSGDLTTDGIVTAAQTARALIWAKEGGQIAGLPLAAAVFRELDPACTVEFLTTDGAAVAAGAPLLRLSGKARAILSGERLALNLLQRLSGIATQTARFVAAVDGYPTRIVDTRKTTPGLRELEKYAVRCGGGYSHRLGLYDAILIKDNHIAMAGGILPALQAARRYASHMTRIAVEVEDAAGVIAALAGGADVILLDNMDTAAMQAAVNKINGRAVVEASGNMSLARVREVAAAGVDIISVGALTHSVTALDISLDIEGSKGAV